MFLKGLTYKRWERTNLYILNAKPFLLIQIIHYLISKLLNIWVYRYVYRFSFSLGDKNILDFKLIALFTDGNILSRFS